MFDPILLMVERVRILRFNTTQANDCPRAIPITAVSHHFDKNQ